MDDRLAGFTAEQLGTVHDVLYALLIGRSREDTPTLDEAFAEISGRYQKQYRLELQKEAEKAVSEVHQPGDRIDR